MTRQRGSLLVLSGPSGAGKSTVIQQVLAQRERVYFSISCTTRAPRPGEQEGVNYYYLSNRQFRELIDRDALLEYAGYVDHYYGTPKAPIQEHLARGWDVILDIEVQGAAIIRQKLPEAVFCFLIPPDLQELERRLRNRQSESEERIQGRLARAREEYKEIPQYDYLVINDNAEQAARELCSILTAADCRVSRYTDC